VSLALVTALLAVVGLGALRIAGDVQASGSVGPPLTMKGVQRHALPTHEYERRTAGGKSWRRGSCDPKRAPILVQQARRMLAEGSGSSGRPPELSCARVFTGRHLYRFREGQRGLWNTSRPVFFDRLYQRTLIWEMGLFRIDGLLDDTWHNRVVHIVSAEGLAGVRNVVLLEDAEPADSGARHRESVRAADPRHLDAVRREGASIRRR
jgi:hypothetical protein